MSEQSEWATHEAELRRRRDIARAMGKPERLTRLAGSNRLNARQRVEALLDPGSFVEIGTLAGAEENAAADGFVAGHGLIDGEPVLVGAEDSTVLGGSIGVAGNAKRTRIAHLAVQHRRPLLMLLDGAGHRATNTLTRRTPSPNDLPALCDLLDAGVPVLVGVFGASAGHGALAAALADVVVMVNGQSQLFTAGPPIVKASTGEDIDKEALGGWAVAGASGVAHLCTDSDVAATELLRHVLAFLRFPALAEPEADGHADPPPDPLASLIPSDLRVAYRMEPVLDALFDDGSVLELHPAHGRALITALARLAGRTVAVVANRPDVIAGSIDAEAARKAADFIEFASRHNVPLVLLADTPGALPGSASERQGILRAGARMFAAQHRHPGPKLHVTLRKAFGFGSSMMGQNPFDRQTVTLALQTATVGAMPAAGAAAASRADNATADDLAEHERGGPWRLADTLSYDEVVAPEEIRPRLIAALRLATA